MPLIGLRVAVIADQYGIEVEDDLARILPPVDESDNNDPWRAPDGPLS